MHAHTHTHLTLLVLLLLFLSFPLSLTVSWSLSLCLPVSAPLSLSLGLPAYLSFSLSLNDSLRHMFPRYGAGCHGSRSGWGCHGVAHSVLQQRGVAMSEEPPPRHRLAADAGEGMPLVCSKLVAQCLPPWLITEASCTVSQLHKCKYRRTVLLIIIKMHKMKNCLLGHSDCAPKEDNISSSS